MFTRSVEKQFILQMRDNRHPTHISVISDTYGENTNIFTTNRQAYDTRLNLACKTWVGDGTDVFIRNTLYFELFEKPDTDMNGNGKPGDYLYREADDAGAQSYSQVNFYIASGIIFFYLGSETTVNGWVVTYLKDSGIMSGEYAQRLLSLLWLVIIFGRLTTAYLSGKFKKSTLTLINSIGAAFMFVVFISTTNLIIITISMVIFGFFFAGIFPTTIALAGNIIKGSSAAMGSLLALGGIGGILMPIIVGNVAQKTNITTGMGMVTISVFLTVLLAFIARIRIKE